MSSSPKPCQSTLAKPNNIFYLSSTCTVVDGICANGLAAAKMRRCIGGRNVVEVSLSLYCLLSYLKLPLVWKLMAMPL